MDKIFEDKREIEKITIPSMQTSHSINSGICTKIEAYRENGEMGHVPWLAVYWNNELKYRYPARMCSIEYKKGK